MDIVLASFFFALIAIASPAIICVPLIRKWGHVWLIPLLFIVWGLLSTGLLFISQEYLFPAFVERTITEEMVCEPVKKYDFKWRNQ